MASIRVEHTIDDLESDLRKIAVTARGKMADIVKRDARTGNTIAKSRARESAGAHGKHYHKAFTAERITPLMWEYGPDAARPQGGMSFEFGSRNQPPHLDLNKSADLIGPQLAKDARDLLGDLFWPES